MPAKRKTIDEKIASLIATRDAGESLRIFIEDPKISEFFDEVEREFIEGMLSDKASDAERASHALAVNTIRRIRGAMKVGEVLGRKAQERIEKIEEAEKDKAS